MSAQHALFSTGISLENFRGYGSFRLEIPPQPCVVLLSGPNGLGKTSLFEAIEWALTGAVKRLDHVSGGKANPRDLARRATDVDSFEASLAFRDSDGQEARVTRAQLIPRAGATVPASVGTPLEDVARLLASGDPRWNVNAENLSDYLHLTHLHAQVASLRLVAFDAKERWLRVSPLAGADRFERVRTNLTNSKKELTALQKRRERAHAEAVTRREHWTARLLRLDQLQKLATAVQDLLSPSDVSRAASEQRLRLALRPVDDVFQEDSLEAASERLRQLRLDIEAERNATDHRLQSLAALRALPQLVADMRIQQTTAKARQVSLGAEKKELEALLITQGQATLSHREALQTAIEAQRTSSERHELILRAQQDRSDLGAFEQQLVEAELEHTAAKQLLDQLELEAGERRLELEAHEALLAELEKARSGLSRTEHALSALTESETLEKRLREDQAKRDRLGLRIEELDASMESAATEIRSRTEATTALAVELGALRQAFDGFQRALLTIADHLGPDDTECPVCHTEFKRGMLRGLARQLLDAGDPKAAVVEQQLREAQAGLEEVRKQQAERELERRKTEADLLALKGNITQLDTRINTLRGNPLLANRGTEEARSELTRVRRDLLADMNRLESDVAQTDLKGRRQAVVDATAAAETQARLHAAAETKRNSRQARLDQLRARISQTQNEHPELARDLQSLRLLAHPQALAAANAKDAADAATARVHAAQAAEKATRQSLTSAETELGKVAALLVSLSETITAQEAQWRDRGVPAPISEPTLDSVMRITETRQRQLGDALAEIGRLGAALDRWRQAAEIRNLEAELRAECGPIAHDLHTKSLDEAVASAGAAATVAQRARDASDELSKALNRVTVDFGGRALKPFDELFRRYVRALIHDERFHTIAATYKPAARSAGLSFKVALGGMDTEAEYILSEGQLGEVSLATMLAASTAFPWSRWRVLLLDDPTQYNDLIHSTALFDVLRNLSRFAGYQIFVSTHETEQASFLRRKLDAIDVPWVDCRYVGHSDNGIVAHVRRSSISGDDLANKAYPD